MSFLIRCTSTALVAAVAAAVLTTTASTAAADEAFYQPPVPLPAGQNGDVIRSQPSNIGSGTATRIMYLSRDKDNRPIPVTGTVIVPSQPWTGPGPRPIVGYAPFTAGIGDQCAPSKNLASDPVGDITTEFQRGFITSLLNKGIAVAQTDYQGLGTPGDHTYVTRLSTAHAVLDVIRAAQRLSAANLPDNGPVGVTGYSQGGGGAAAAVELAPQYAPELSVRGAYVGAPPADLAVMAKSIDGTYAAGFGGFAIVGTNAAYPELGFVDKVANARGKQVFEEIRRVCTVEALLRYGGLRTRDLTVDGRSLSDYLAEEPYKSVAEAQKIGKLKPNAPVEVEHSPTDDIVPYGQGKQMARDWCGRGASVQFNDLNVIPVFSHAVAVPAAQGNSANWLADRFNGVPAPNNCGQF